MNNVDRQRDNRRALLWVGMATAIGLFLRLWQIAGEGLWIDEAFSVWIARQSLPAALSWLVRIDQHPPLYYVLLHLWLRLGDDAATVRALSAIVSTLNIPAIYALGRRLLGSKVGMVAAVVLALSPFHIRFAQEARMYALLSLNVSLSMLSLAYLLTDPRASSEPLGRSLLAWLHARRTSAGRPPAGAVRTDLAWAGYVAFTAATMLTHNTAVLYLAAANVFVLGWIGLGGRRPGEGRWLVRPSLRNWGLAQVGVLLLWSPWLGAFTVQALAVYREFWIPAPTWRTVVETVQSLLCWYLPQRLSWAWVIWIGYGLLLLLGTYRLRRRPGRAGLLWVAALTPLAGEWLVSLVRPIFFDHTLIWTTIPLYLLLALGIRQLSYRSFVLTALAMVATVNGLSIREYHVRFQKEQWDEAAAYVSDRAEAGDLILFHATWVQIPFDYYFYQPVEERGVPVDLFDSGVLEPKMTAGDLPRMEALIRDRTRVWLVYSHQWYTDPQGLVPAALDRALELQLRRRFYGLDVRLYGTDRGEP